MWKRKTFNERVEEEVQARIRLQKEREESKEFNIYGRWDGWIYIIECIWHKIKRIKQYRLDWYNLYRQAVFWLVDEFRPIYE